jgi:ribosome-binding protein aMBF1 (putative translation factor)
MNEIKIVKEIMGAKGFSSKTLAEKIKGDENALASYVSNRLQSKTMTVEKLLELLDALDCKLIIQHTVGDKEKYVVDNEERNDVKVYKKKGDNE